jgi:hypothetical protein
MVEHNAESRFAIGRNPATAVVVSTACALFMLPLIAMQFTAEVTWDATDFAVWFVLLSAAGAALVWMIHKAPRRKWLVRGALVVALFLWIWAELAVGVFTNLGS